MNRTLFLFFILLFGASGTNPGAQDRPSVPDQAILMHRIQHMADSVAHVYADMIRPSRVLFVDVDQRPDGSRYEWHWYFRQLQGEEVYDTVIVKRVK